MTNCYCYSNFVRSGNASQEAKAIGSYSSNVLKMNVVPVSGKEHYALSLDLSGQTPAKTCSIFRNNTATSTGTVKRISYRSDLSKKRTAIGRCGKICPRSL
ncbi:MAG: hypothetical protein ABR985_17525 [Methanotrichaceae archaeon]